MKNYLAGTTVSNPRKEKKIQELFKRGHKLHSYFHCQDKGFERFWWKMNKKNKVQLFLDSGAFSAFTQKVEIDIQEYIKFIKKHKKYLTVYANLDVIGSPEGTWENQQIMEEAGLKPLPCYHFGEDPKWLKRYLDAGHDYIALGGMVGRPRPALLQWLDTIWSDFLTDSKGMPVVKVHGFGMTSLRLMLRYPWYSVDSTSWVVTGRLGSIFVPRYRDGQWIYDEDSWKIDVSSKSPSLKQRGQHIDTMSPKTKKVLIQYITHKGYSLGESTFKTVPLDYELKEDEKWACSKKDAEAKGERDVEVIVERGLCNDYRLRDELNIIYFLDLEKDLPKYPWPLNIRKRKSLF